MINISKLKFTLAILSVLALGGVTSSSATAQSGNSNAGNKVTICHATGSSSNPYVVISPNANGVVNGHSGSGHQDGRDIIPPFSYNDSGTTRQFSGQNWNATGQAIYNNGCKATTGGRGGSAQPQSITSTPGSTTLGATTGGVTTGGRGAGGVVNGAQVQAPTGAVAAGVGSGSAELNPASVVGLLSSLAIAGFGLRQLKRL